MREDQHECQQQMIEILEKVSDQIRKVENAHSGSIPVIEGEYYTPPVSEMKMNKSSKLSGPPNLPIFSGQELVPITKGSIDQWLFQVEGALATHMEEAVRSAVIGSVRGAARELWEFIGYGEEMSVILRHIKERFGQGPSKAKLWKEFFLMEQNKNKVSTNFQEELNNDLKDWRHYTQKGMTEVNWKKESSRGCIPTYGILCDSYTWKTMSVMKNF